MMDDLTSGVDPDDLMELDDAEGSDLEEDDEDVIEDALPSPLQLPSSGPASTATSAASSPPTNDDNPPVFNFSGKPLNIKRGRGRPRREGGKPAPKKQNLTNRKKWKTQGGYFRVTPSPGDETSIYDPETGSLILSDRERPCPIIEELPYAPEQWPGKVCAFCNLGERSQLGQGELLRLICSEGFTPQRIILDTQDFAQVVEQIPERELGDKSPRGGPVTCRRQKSFNKCRHPSMTSEYVDELTIIGYVEQPDVTTLFETTGHFYVHRSCALWSNGVNRAENTALVNVDQAVLLSASKKCSHCTHFGASVSCKKDGCNKLYHFPCTTASQAFQDISSLLVFCINHIMQVSLFCEASVCYTCKMLGDVANLMFCSMCGEHYHGTCVGLSQVPGVRAGWQCRKCKVCQVCRMVGDESKLMACETCDKVYHAMCQRPVVTSIPKYGWKCRCCRVCGDCGSRTPGAGLSSRWHAHYTVCDSCYQQRNKGCSCPLCGRAYRAHAHREMVQCVLCRKFVHGTCDPEADLTTYHQRKEAHPEYDYICPNCKNVTQQGRPILTKRNSIEDAPDSLSASQESLADDIYEYDERCMNEDFRPLGLGRGKPYSASKIAKKRLGLATGMPGRPKGVGKGIPGKAGFMKRQKVPEFGRKRGPKSKMRGVFGVPGVGLQRPVSDGKNDEECGIENKLILCSAKDKFVLTQDICVMCGALGTDQEGCLIACVQCGQCYHPYCVNVKVTKVILQKGWHCLDCIVCQGCGQRNDEARLLLCDDCDISYHIYCMDPPLNYVPQGTWKCKWCAVCQTCGATDPGFNCHWMNSYSECGPCASLTSCGSCLEPYSEGDLIVQCVQCSRWLHGACDSIRTEAEAEKCSEEGYNCLMCRPRDVAPPHLVPLMTMVSKPPTPTKSPEGKSNGSGHYLVDGVYLSEMGHSMIKSMSLEQHSTRKKRKKLPTVQDKEAGIMATIESVIASSSSAQDSVDIKDEPLDMYKEGMIWGKEDGPPPEGFTLFTMENGVTVLRRKRQRNLQKLGIGGFLVRVRGIRNGQDNDDIDMLPGQSTDPFALPTLEGDKPKRKPIRRKIKSKLAETFPPYLQEAFFGKELLDTSKDIGSSSGSEEEPTVKPTTLKSIHLSQDEIKAVAAVANKHDNRGPELMQHSEIKSVEKSVSKQSSVSQRDDEESDADDLNLAIPGELLDTELVNTIMNEDDDELTKNTDTLENLADTNLADDLADSLTGGSSSKDTKDEFSDILGPHFNFPNINSKDVEDIFKGVLTDESQESQESSVFSTNSTTVFNPATPAPQQQSLIISHPIPTPAVRPTTLSNINQNNLNSPMSFPPQSPYHSEYSNSPQFSPAFSEPPSPWVSVNETMDMDGALAPSNNQRSSEKMKADEGLGGGATISAVLYANTKHPEWKTEYPAWSDRYKQIIKKWRTLTNEQKAPFLQQAKDNRSALRMKKQQQINKDPSSSSPGATTAKAAANPTQGAPAVVVTQSPAVVEVCTATAVAITTTVTTTTTTTVVVVTTTHQQYLPTHHHATTNSINIINSISGSVSISIPTAAPVVCPTVTTTTSTTTPAAVVPILRSLSLSPSTNLIPSVQTRQQFTVHGQFMGPGDRCGPAPNVTVNPHYQPNITAAAVDQQIRVLTPSEIMRTLPSLCQENYEQGQLSDPEKSALHQKSAREAEQERQWKQLQALRQQHQQQQQQQLMQDRGIGRVHRQLSEPTQPTFLSPDQQPIQQEIAVPPPPPNPRPFTQMGIKSPSFGPTLTNLAPQRQVQTPTVVQQHPPSSVPFDFLPTEGPPQDLFTNIQAPATPKPVVVQPGTPQPRLPLPADPYVHQPTTPRPPPQFPVTTGVQGVRESTGIEINRQLRDLLQRQQFKKLDEQLLLGKGQQRVWPPADGNEEQQVIVPVSAGDPTFRHPLPPGVRPRVPIPAAVRQPGTIVGLRMQPSDHPRLQGLDPRTRILLQHHQVQQQQQQRAATPMQQPQPQFPQTNQRFPAARPVGVEQYEQIQRQVFQPRIVATDGAGPRMPLNPALSKQQVSSALPTTTTTTTTTTADSSDQEIPDNVTAELEKLEQDGTMAELQVADILGGLPDDDDELLAEMGNDFNILEYADPELDALTGDKTNILDSLDLEEPEPVKDDKKAVPKPTGKKPPTQIPASSPSPIIKTEPKLSINTSVGKIPTSAPPLQQTQPPPPPPPQQQQQQPPPPPQPVQHPPQLQGGPPQLQGGPPQLQGGPPQLQGGPPQLPGGPPQLTHQQQLHQQMLFQVQQAAAQGKPMLPGTKLMSSDGIIGTVTQTNNIVLSFPAGYQQRLTGSQLQQQLHMQKLRQNALAQNPRMAGAVMHGGVGMVPTPRMPVGNPPPPPPPYPGPPPPYPGSTTPQMGLRMGGPVHTMMGPHRLPIGLANGPPMPPRPQGGCAMPPMYNSVVPRRPLLLEEQPLLLKDLLEQEKREQEKQLQTQVPQSAPEVVPGASAPALLSDHDFEKLKADVFSSGPISFGSNSASNSPVPKPELDQNRPTYQKQVSAPAGTTSGGSWQQPPPTPTAPVPLKVPTFNANLQPAPPLPPEHVVTEQDKQIQMAYEEWLNHQNGALSQQQRFYDGEVQKLRKQRKSLNSKQRQLKKSGNQLTENDAVELERVSQEQAILQKHLESSRKQVRQHAMLMQEYRNKQQANKRPVGVPGGQSPLMSIPSPLGPPGASPIHTVNTPQSPGLMSPTASPMTQHSSPMHSPAPLLSHSPGPGSVNVVLQSPGNNGATTMSPMQPSPRIGTPHSQSEGSPGPVQSPSMCLPPPMPRMTSPQHRRIVTSPIGYTGELRPGTPQVMGQLRFVRPPVDANLQQRRIQSPSPGFQQKPGAPSPLNSPPAQHMINQQLLQRQLQQQVLLQQQQQGGENNAENVLVNTQRILLLNQQRQLAMRQQMVAQQQQQASNQPQPLTPQQHQMMVQQQQHLAKQQQQQIAMQVQNRMVQQHVQQHVQPPNSPMPPSPLLNQPQIMSPHSMHSQPASPMPPRSPIVSGSPIPRSPALHHQPPSSPMPLSHPPSSPMPRSPMINPIQSPMGIRRPPSSGSSPIIDRPTSVENPGTPRMVYHMDDHGGGNPMNPANPIPGPPPGFEYCKLGLKGGSPMWGYGKKMPNDGKEDKNSNNSGEIPAPPKFKKESHVNRVSILKKNTSPVKSNLQTLTANHRISLVSSDYSEFDDSSSTPPVTPPPSSSGNPTRAMPRSIGKKMPPPPDPHSDQPQILMEESPEPISLMDYDDDNVVSAEVSLSAAAQQADHDDIAVIESFNQSELPETFSSPLESDQIPDDFVLFDISGGVHYSEKEEDEEEEAGYHLNDKNMQIVIQSPTTSDEELILQDKCKETSDLTLNLVEGIDDQLLINESEHEAEPMETDTENFDKSQIIFIDSHKSPEEQISTKEDFEELIDEGSRNEKIIKPDVINSKHINEFHKYAANIYTQKNQPSTVKQNSINVKSSGSPIQKISLITAPIVTTSSKVNVKKDVNQKQNLTNIILQPSRSIITVPKLMTSQFVNIVPTHYSVPVISASAVSKLPNVKVIEKPTTSLSLTTHDLPKKIFEDDSKSSDCDEEKIKLDQQFNRVKESYEEVNKKNENNVKDEVDEKVDKKKSEDDDKEKKIVSNVAADVKTPVTSGSSLILRNPPELKMTAQVIQESQGIITSGTIERMPYISQTIEEVDNSNELDNKSVVISIPSPTPSQEQILDHIALQELETRRQGGWIDVLEMFEGNLIDDKFKLENEMKKTEINVDENLKKDREINKDVNKKEKENPSLAAVIATSRATTMPQLSPLSQPAELTNNVANVSQQLRSLLSSLNTTTATTSSNVSTVARNVYNNNKEKDKVHVTTTVNVVTTTRQESGGEKSGNGSVIKNIKVNTPKSSPGININNQSNNNQSGNNQVTTTTNNLNLNHLITSNNKVEINSENHPKLVPITTNNNNNNTTTTSNTQQQNNISTIQKTLNASLNTTLNTTLNTSLNTTLNASNNTIVTSSSNITMATRKTSLSLNEMLQSHPAATTPQTSPGTITTASILSSSMPLKSASFSPTLVQAQTNVVTTTTTSQNNSSQQQYKPTITTTNLLHSQLTKSVGPVHRAKSLDEMLLDNKKKEETVLPITASSLLKDGNFLGKEKFGSAQNMRGEDSQNVLLKQLLQNTGCASVTTTSSATVSTTTASTTAPSLPIVPNLEAQLARPVPPTPSSLIPSILQNDSLITQNQHVHQNQLNQQQNQNQLMTQNQLITQNQSQFQQQQNQLSQSQQKTQPQKQPLMTRETSFVSKPVIQPSTTSLTPVTMAIQHQHQQLHIDIMNTKKVLGLPPSRTPSRDELLSPPTPRSTCSQDSNLTTPPLLVPKKEPSLIPTTLQTLQSPLLTPQEVKKEKEFVDETSQHSEVSDHSRGGELQMIKDELMEVDEKMDKEELKKLKRRMYQQKRRQNQIMNKEGQPKKRPRKSSKVDEDYDSFIDSLLSNLRTLPPMIVSEPVLNKNFGVVPVFGSGELFKLGTKDYDSRVGDLTGNYGNAIISGYADYYTSKPYGDDEPSPEKPPASTQRGFYDQEFSLIKFDCDEYRRLDAYCRDDSPDSIMSSSSPECTRFEPICKFSGLKLIDEDDEFDDDNRPKRVLSPKIPIITPIPIRLKPLSGLYLKDYGDVDKENIAVEKEVVNKSKFGPPPPPAMPLKESGNVTVTLTLTSSAAEDIMGVLRDLANILHIPAPTSYQIVERTSTPPSQKLGLYRTKGKDGKEGAPIDIQSILNGAAKFCKHCDVVILNNMIRKKLSEIPLLNKELLKDTDNLSDGDELYFCSTNCYTQFALINRSPALCENKAAAIVDHLCQKDKAEVQRKRQILEKQLQVYQFESYNKKSLLDLDLHIKKDDFLDDLNEKYEFKPKKEVKYKKYSPGCLQPANKFKKPSDKETIELLYKMGITVVPNKAIDEIRKCMFCHNIGDGVADGPARLLNFDVDKWVHLNCALWSDGVYETVNGALMHLENALQQSLVSTCVHCNQPGATIRCFKTRCLNNYHLPCAIKDNCVFYKNKTTYCTAHVPKGEKDNELTTLSVSRRVYVNRDENRQVAAVMHHSDQNNLLRVGSLIFLSVGQLLPHQLQNFHTSNYIYPIGYKIVRFYWSMRHLNKRCRYVCSIHETLGRPEFRIVVQELNEEDVELRDMTAKGVWTKVLDSIAVLRRENKCVQIFSKYITGEDLFGLTEPAVVRVLESLPGIETLTDYKFKYGRNPLLELPLAINPSGAARTEPRLRNQMHWKRAHTQRTGSSARPVFPATSTGTTGEVACPYSKQFVHSKSSQYKKMKQEWRNNVYLARSKIQGLGLYAARDLEKHTMVIEYIGEIIRTELAETREKKYEAKNRGIYMFRLDEERVVDATLCGGLARYINHSCNPNCVAEIVEVDRDLRIIIFAKRRIQRGEELAYDYKFDIEDDQHKISCMCGAPNCRKWMN